MLIEQRKKEIETRAAKFGIELNAFPVSQVLEQTVGSH